MVAIIRSVPGPKQANIVKHLRDSAYYDASLNGNDIEIGGLLASEPSIKPFRLIKSGLVQAEAVTAAEAWLTRYKHADAVPTPSLDMDDFRKTVQKPFPADWNLGTRLYKLMVAFFSCSPDQFREVVESFAPRLSDFAGVTDIWFLGRSSVVSSRFAGMRALYASQHMRDLITGGRGPFRGFNTLKNLDSVEGLGVEDKLKLFFVLFSPYFCGSATDRVGGTVVTMLPELKDFRARFPPRVQDVLRTDLSPFAEDKEIADREKGVPVTFSTEQLTALFERYIDNLASLERALLDPTRFIDSDHRLNSRRWLLSNLTIKRLFRDALDIQTEYLSQYLRKLLTFHFIDAISQTLKHHPRIAGDPRWSEARIFKALLGRDILIKILAARLSTYPKPFGNYLRNRARRDAEELHKKIVSGVFVPGRRVGDRITVGTAQISLEEYVTSFLREVRNTHHGYDIDKFDILEIHDGNLPDCLADLPVLYLLALLQDPDLILEAKLLP